MDKTEMKPCGTAYISGFGTGVGFHIIFNPYKFIKGRNKGKMQCYIRKGSKFKKVILEESDIKPFEKNDGN